MRIDKAGVKPDDSDIHVHHVLLDDLEIEDIAEGLDCYVEALEEHELTDHSEKIKLLKAMSNQLRRALNN